VKKAPHRRVASWIHAVALGSALYACGSRAAFTGSAPEYSMPCDERKRRLVSFLERLPESSTVASVSVELPSSTLGSPPGSGRTIELSEAGLRIEGQLTPAGDADASFDRFVAAFAMEVAAAKQRDANARLALYVAAADSVTIGELRRYLVRVPDGVPLRLLVRANTREARLEAEAGTPERAREIAEGLLTELDAARRASLSREGYDAFSNCAAFDDGASKSVELSSAERWPALRRHALAALPGCSCEQFDTLALRVLFAAEQRAGAATLASVPFSFVKDERCGATMPLRSVKTLLAQMEKFDEADSADFRNDAVTFDAIITNERLREQFCDALPGETLAALGRARRTVYWKLSGTECDAWQFEPMAKGAPMGTLRRVKSQRGRPPVSFHYWQAAEQLGVFGPLADGVASKPTDTRAFPCRQDLELVAVDPQRIELENGGMYFSEAACRAASGAPASAGCVAALAAGVESAAGAADQPEAPAAVGEPR
jgi:hypothetical protein